MTPMSTAAMMGMRAIMMKAFEHLHVARREYVVNRVNIFLSSSHSILLRTFPSTTAATQLRTIPHLRCTCLPEQQPASDP